MPDLTDSVDADFLRRKDEARRQDNLAWYQSQLSLNRPQQALGGFPAAGAPKQDQIDQWWDNYLSATAADMGNVLVSGLTLGIIKGRNVPVLGRIIEQYATPEERKSTVQKVVEFGGELLAGALVGGPLLGPVGRAAAGLLPRTAGLIARGAVRGAAEGGVLGAAQATAGAVRGEETPESAAWKVGGGVALGGVFGAAIGKVETILKAKADQIARAKRAVTGLQEEAVGTEAAALDQYEKDVIAYAKSQFIEPAERVPIHPEAEMTSAAPRGPIVAGPVREPIAALPPAPEIEQVAATERARDLFKRADRLEAQKEGLGLRGKAFLDERIKDLRDQAQVLAAAEASQAIPEGAAASGLAKDVEQAVAEAKRRGILLPGDPTGNVNTALATALARAVIGGLVGGTQGDTPEDHWKNALLGAGIGAAMSPALFKYVTSSLAKGMPKVSTEAAEVATPKSTQAVTEPTIAVKPPAQAKIRIAPVGSADAKQMIQEGLNTTKIGKVEFHIPFDDIERGVHITKGGEEHSLDGIIKSIATRFKNEINFERRGVQSDEVRQAAAERLGMTLEDYLAKTRGTVLNDQEVTQFSGMVAALHDRVLQLNELAKVDPSKAQNLYNLFPVLVASTRKMFGFTAEAGRSFRAWGEVPRALKTGLESATAIGDLLGTDTAGEMLRLGVTPKQLHAMIDAMTVQRGKTQNIEGLGQWITNMQNGFIEAWINGLLSNPATHTVNFLGNMMPLFGAIPERALAARFHTGAIPGVVPGEASEMLYGLFSGFSDAFKAASKSWRTGTSVFDALATKVETATRTPAITAENLGLDAASQFGNAVNLLGQVVRTPGKLMQASDEFFKLLNYRMELAALTYRTAKQMAGDGENFAEILGRLRTETPDTLLQQSVNFAKYQTFTSDLGEFGQALQRFSNSHPAVKLLIPFVKTPINILNYTWEHSPGLNLLSSQIQRDIAIGGAQRDLALAKMALGSMVVGTAAMLAGGGILTGRGPTDKVLRARLEETGWQPYSMKIGNSYYAFNRIDPVGAMLGFVADYADAVAHVDEMTGMKAAAALWVAFARNVTSKTYMQGVANALEAMTDQSLSGIEKVESYFELQAKSLVPRFIAQMNRSYFDPTTREVNGVMDALMSQVPGFSGTLPPRRDLYGNPVYLEGGLGPDVMSPIYTRTAKLDPVSDEIAKQGIRVVSSGEYVFGGRPPQGALADVRAGQGIQLTPLQRDRWSVLAGQEVKGETGKNLHDTLADVIATREYRSATDGPDGGKARMLQRTIRDFREAAERRLIEEEPALQFAIAQKRQQRIAVRYGTEQAGAGPAYTTSVPVIGR